MVRYYCDSCLQAVKQEEATKMSVQSRVQKGSVYFCPTCTDKINSAMREHVKGSAVELFAPSNKKKMEALLMKQRVPQNVGYQVISSEAVLDRYAEKFGRINQNRQVPAEKFEQVARLFNAGVSSLEISKAIDVSYSTTTKYVNWWKAFTEVNLIIDKGNYLEGLRERVEGVDVAKVIALHKGSWGIPNIADEMGITQLLVKEIIEYYKEHGNILDLIKEEPLCLL